MTHFKRLMKRLYFRYKLQIEDRKAKAIRKSTPGISDEEIYG